jgi:adenylate kinase
MFRAAIAAGTPLGKRVEPILASGELVPDELTVAVLRERLGEDDAADGFVLDGFPRNPAQAEALDAMLSEIGRTLDIVLELQVPEDVVRERMVRRAAEENRPDDTPDVIDRRLEIYRRDTAPLVERYRSTGRLVGIHGDRPVPEVFGEIQEALEHVRARAEA